MCDKVRTSDVPRKNNFKLNMLTDQLLMKYELRVSEATKLALMNNHL